MTLVNFIRLLSWFCKLVSRHFVLSSLIDKRDLYNQNWFEIYGSRSPKLIADALNRAAIAITGSPYPCFLFLLFLCRSFALLTCDIGNWHIGFGHAYHHQRQQRRFDSKRLRGNSLPRGHRPWTVEIIIPGHRDNRLGHHEWKTTLRTRQGGERSRHASRYWRFVQVVRRPGRRRLQKYDHRRPDTDHWPKRPGVREEGV